MTDQTEPKLKPVRLVTNAIAAAKPAPVIERPAGDVGVSGADFAGVDDRRPQKPGDLGLPDPCPVTPLGVQDDKCFYLDARRQLRGLKPQEHSKSHLVHLFGERIDYAWRFFPRLNKDGVTVGWRADGLDESLKAAAHKCGIWDPTNRERGAGAWRGRDGELLLHVGDAVLSCSLTGAAEGQPAWRELTLGRIGREVYPAAPAMPRPWSGHIKGGADGPAMTMLDTLRTWAWDSPEIGPQLMLGWIGAALIGGALKWRPAAWVTGGSGTGKSTLMELLNLILDEGLIEAADASAAGLWQRLKMSTLPVMVDELEADADNRKVDAVIKLARLAAGGGKILRGGADHKGTEFEARCCFLFSSINVPPLLSQDASRIAVLELGRLADRSTPPDMDPAAMHDLGAKLRRRMVQGFPRLGDAIINYSAALAVEGHDSRGCDVFGTLLACADLLLHDYDCTGEEASAWALKVRAAAIAAAIDGDRDEDACLTELVTYPIDPFRKGSRHAVGDWIIKAAGYYPEGFDDITTREAKNEIRKIGLAIKEQDGRMFLAVAYYHRGLAPIYADSQWKSRPGAPGVWARALLRLHGALRANGSIRFAGEHSTALLIPIELIVTPEIAALYAEKPGEAHDAL